MSKQQVSAERTTHNGVASRSKARIEQLHALGALPGMLKTRAEANPRAALIVVAAGAFVMGGLVGSRLGRLIVEASIPLLIGRALDGTLGKELLRLAGAPDASAS
jgi:hypothetical protein